jgi:hypothetical protein
MIFSCDPRAAALLEVGEIGLSESLPRPPPFEIRLVALYRWV